jgi:hypothetical protein
MTMEIIGDIGLLILGIAAVLGVASLGLGLIALVWALKKLVENFAWFVSEVTFRSKLIHVARGVVRSGGLDRSKGPQDIADTFGIPLHDETGKYIPEGYEILDAWAQAMNELKE